MLSDICLRIPYIMYVWSLTFPSPLSGSHWTILCRAYIQTVLWQLSFWCCLQSVKHLISVNAQSWQMNSFENILNSFITFCHWLLFSSECGFSSISFWFGTNLLAKIGRWTVSLLYLNISYLRQVWIPDSAAKHSWRLNRITLSEKLEWVLTQVFFSRDTKLAV